MVSSSLSAACQAIFDSKRLSQEGEPNHTRIDSIGTLTHCRVRGNHLFAHAVVVVAVRLDGQQIETPPLMAISTLIQVLTDLLLGL